MIERAGIRGHAPGRDGAVLQRPQELPVPLFAFFLGFFDLGQCPRDPFISTLDVLVDGFASLGLETVFLSQMS